MGLAQPDPARLGLIADIHADFRALESSLRYLDQLGVARILCAGDVVGYGSHADDVVALLRERSIPCLRGNHDRWALERRQVIGIRGWKAAAFRAETWEFLEELPTSLHVACGPRRVAVFHGSPASDTEYVTPYKPVPESIDRFWDASDADLLVLGHTHIPMVDRTLRGTLLNPGSVVGVSGVQTSYSFAVVDLASLAVCWYEIRTGRELRRDPIFVDEAEDFG
jgi:putative phosphoesterase